MALIAFALSPRQRTPASRSPAVRDGTNSAGFSVTLPASPEMKRFIPVIGSMTVAAISFHSRDLPVFVGSRMSHPVRCSISPIAMPPTVVLMRSFTDGLCVSPKYSQVALPSAASGADSQKLRPFDLPALK